jgi:acetyl esterase/lipase
MFISSRSTTPRVLRFTRSKFHHPEAKLMLRFLSSALFLLGLSIAAGAQTPVAWQPSSGHTQIPIWPKGAPDAKPNPAAESDATTAKDNLIASKPLIRLGNVSTPTITLYQPTTKPTGAAIVVFPGGGYHILAIDLEGTEVCDWLTSRGVACIILKYRVR